MPELKACPFCGGEAEATREDEDHRWTGDCQQWLIDGRDPEDACSAGIGYYDTREEAIAAWNRRTPDYQALAQELAKALAHLEGCREWNEDDDAALAHAKAAGLL
jgi:hypothetical protein